MVIRQHNLTKKACDGGEMLRCCILAFAGFLTDLKLNGRIQRGLLASCGRRCDGTALWLLYQMQIVLQMKF